MSIINNEIVENVAQESNRYVSYLYTFHNGDVLRFNSLSKPLDYDVNAGLITYAAIAEEKIIEVKDSELIAQIESEDIMPMDAIPEHPDTETINNRKKRLRRKLLRQIASNPDLKVIRKVFYPVWYWLKYESGYTVQQIANYLNCSVSVMQRINNRFQALHDNLTFVDADNSYLGEVDE